MVNRHKHSLECVNETHFSCNHRYGSYHPLWLGHLQQSQGGKAEGKTGAVRTSLHPWSALPVIAHETAAVLTLGGLRGY